jgi:hypothetical protein
LDVDRKHLFCDSVAIYCWSSGLQMAKNRQGVIWLRRICISVVLLLATVFWGWNFSDPSAKLKSILPLAAGIFVMVRGIKNLTEGVEQYKKSEKSKYSKIKDDSSPPEHL